MENKRKIYELTISKNYVKDWGTEEAVREIMQNAIDSETDGNEMEISYNSGTLRIANRGVNLDISTLVMGSTSKGNGGYIGSKGEGQKLAIAVLLREGLIPTIYTNGQKWEASFRKSRKFKIETLHIDVYEDDSYERDIIEFEIRGMDYELFKDIRSKNIAILRNMGHGIGEVEESEYGEILLDKDYEGQMYVNGLFIQEDSTFDYGYNFKSEYVELDRDRKAINYYKLKELTARALSSQKNFRLIHDSLSKSGIDTKNLADTIDDMTEEFTQEFAQDFIDRNDIDKDTFVGTKKEIEICGKEKTFEAPKAVAKIVAIGLDKLEEYEEVEEKFNNLSSVQQGWEYYNGSDYKKLIEYIKSIKSKITKEELEKFIKIINTWRFTTSSFSHIREDVLKDLRGVELNGTEK